MNISYEKPLVISIDSASVRVGNVYPQLGHIRIEGWISAPTRAECFAACREFAERMEVKSVGAYCADDTNCNAPFSFDIQPGWVNWTRKEDLHSETLARVFKMLRSAKWYFRKVSPKALTIITT